MRFPGSSVLVIVDSGGDGGGELNNVLMAGVDVVEVVGGW